MRLFITLCFALISLVSIAQDSLSVAISPDPVTGSPRRAYHQSFVITPDLNMIQEIRIVTMHTSGIPMLQYIKQDNSLSAAQRVKAIQRFADQVVTKSTVDSYIKLATGALVTKPQPPVKYVPAPGLGRTDVIPTIDPTWTGDPTVVNEKVYFQKIDLAALKAKGITITDKTSVANLIYALLLDQIKMIDSRNEL